MNSGVYLIINTMNNKYYIGSSFDIQKRFTIHKRELRSNSHHCAYLQRAWNKYGGDNFSFRVIEFCTKETCRDREQYFIDQFKPQYNTSLSATAPMTGRKHSAETLEKFKLRKKVSGPSHHAYGKTISAEHKRKLINFLTGRKHSAATREKMRITALSQNRIADLDKCRQLTMRKVKSSEGIIFDSCTLAAKYYNISVQTLCDILKGRHSKTRKGISFVYA